MSFYSHAKGLSKLADWEWTARKRYPVRTIKFMYPRKALFAPTPYLKRAAGLARGAGYRGYFPHNRWALAGTAAYAGMYLGRRMYRRYRRKKRYSRSRGRVRTRNKGQFGRRPGTDTTKLNFLWESAIANRDGRTLHHVDITNIPKGTSINDRQRDLVNLRGFKINGFFRNRFSAEGVLHIALLQPKFEKTLEQTDFFRTGGTAGSNSRGSDFSLGLTGLEMASLRINPDKFNIIYHSRITLKPAAYEHGSSYRMQNKYFPVNRQLSYDDDNTPKCNSPIFFVWWYDNIASATATSIIVDNIESTYTIHALFKDPRN